MSLASLRPAAADWLRAFGAEPVEAAGASTFQDLRFAPRQYREVLDGALALARAAGRLPQAFRVLGDGEARLAALGLRLDHRRRRGTVAGRPAPSVVLLDGVDPPRAAGWWVPDLATHAAGRPLWGEAGRPPRPLTPDELAATDPDTLVVALPGATADAAGTALRAALPAWPPLRSAREGRLWTMDGELVHRPGPNLVRAVEVLAAALHGDAAGVAPENGELRPGS